MLAVRFHLIFPLTLYAKNQQNAPCFLQNLQNVHKYFCDFSNDGYTRTNRKKASVNLRDTDHAKERYQEIADIVRFGKSELNIFTEKEYYEGKIDPENGADWNQSAPIDTIPTLEDFKKTVSDYLAWEVSTLLKGKSSEDNERLGK